MPSREVPCADCETPVRFELSWCEWLLCHPGPRVGSPICAGCLAAAEANTAAVIRSLGLNLAPRPAPRHHPDRV